MNISWYSAREQYFSIPVAHRYEVRLQYFAALSISFPFKNSQHLGGYSFRQLERVPTLFWWADTTTNVIGPSKDYVYRKLTKKLLNKEPFTIVLFDFHSY